MKSHTSEFKEEIKTLGKQQSVRITYTLNNEQIILTNEDINSATPNYEASLLKSVMKALELDSNVSIPKGTEIKFEYGLLVNGSYEYLDYGNYIVAKEPEKQEGTLSYKITCYDKMLYSMKDYEHIDITYPCTIKQYLIALCNKIGLQFKDSDFANANRQITSELFMTINEDGTYSSMGYTYRDVLDQIAETTGGCICMTLDDKVEVRYINKLYNKKSATGNTIHLTDSSDMECEIVVNGNAEQDGEPTPDTPIEVVTVGSNANLCDNSRILVGINPQNSSEKDFRTSDYIKVEYGKNYVASLYNEKKVRIGNLVYQTWNKNFKKLQQTTTDTIKITNQDIAYVTIRNYKKDAEKIKNEFYYKFEKSLIATPYSPYGQGSVEIEVCNKNEFDGIMEQGNISGTTGSNVTESACIRSKNYIKIRPSKSYFFEREGKLTDAVGLRFYDKDKNIISSATTTIGYGVKNKIFTTVANAYYMRFTDWTNDLTNKYLLAQSNVATDYIPHESQTAILPIQQEMLEGDYITDVEHHEWEKLILDGTEKLGLSGATTDEILVAVLDISGAKDGYGCSNYFVYSSTVKQNSITVYNNGKNLRFCVNKNEFLNLEAFKAWLKLKYDEGNPVIVYYKLATPVNLELTEEQKSIRDTKLYTYENITNINTSDDLVKLDITYATSKETINEEYINDTNVNFGEKYRTNQFNCTCKSWRK